MNVEKLKGSFSSPSVIDAVDFLGNKIEACPASARKARGAFRAALREAGERHGVTLDVVVSSPDKCDVSFRPDAGWSSKKVREKLIVIHNELNAWMPETVDFSLRVSMKSEGRSRDALLAVERMLEAMS